MTLKIPDWLTETFIQTCLKSKKENTHIEIQTFDMSSVLPPGSNFGGCLLRVEVKYKVNNAEDVHNISLIVKGPAEDPSVTEFFKEVKDVESIFYRQFLPLASEISSCDSLFAPTSYISPIPSIIVLDDLKAQGYTMVNRMELLDYDHCRLYVINSAAFHALSVAVHKVNPKLVESMGKEKLYSDDIKTMLPMKKYTSSAIIYFAEKMEHMDQYTKYCDIIRNFTTHLWEMIANELKPNSTLNVLNQADPWTANMMFRYNQSGKVTDMKILDYQVLRYSPPGSDLVVFLWTSAKHEVRENNLEDLYHLYCDTFNRNLEKYNCPERLTYEQLAENLKRLSPFALLHGASQFPFIIHEKSFDASLMNENCDENKRRSFLDEIHNKDFSEQHFPRLLRQFECAGVFDYMETFTQKS